MEEVVGNIWDYYDQGKWIVITTNGFVKSNGKAVMGRGIALEAATRFPTTPYILGKYIKELGNIPIRLNDRMVSFPVKHNWWEKANLDLIESSTLTLFSMVNNLQLSEIYMVRPGCGNGHLNWSDVKPILKKYLDDRFIIVNRT